MIKKVFDHKEASKKWSNVWDDNNLYTCDIKNAKKPFYNLWMFPYPSGARMHVGHAYASTGSDIIGRYKRMQGFDVFQPMGFDAFGIHGENYAIKVGEHPAQLMEDLCNRFRDEQFKAIGHGYDWSKEVRTYWPEYYKWTQWLFLKLYKAGLAERKEAQVNWCSSCKTVLADEQVIAGECERCHSRVLRKQLKQWFFKITKYAGKLLDNLDKIDWSPKVIEAQRNWIGRSEGAEVKFEILSSFAKSEASFGGKLETNSNIEIRNKKEEQISVFTTRPDTLFGATYLVLAPEHPAVSKITTKEQSDEVQKYVTEAQSKSEIERTGTDKEKTGVFTGSYAINPINGEKIPIWVADYVLAGYGTGAIMAVPAHDSRDFDFATKFNLSIKQAITTNTEDYQNTLKVLETLKKIFEATLKKGIKFWVLGGLAIPFYCKAIYRNHEDLDLIVKDEKSQKEMVGVLEDLGFLKTHEKKLTKDLTVYDYRDQYGVQVELGLPAYFNEFDFREEDFEDEIKEVGGYKSRVISKRFIKSFKEYQVETRKKEKDLLDLDYLNGKSLTEDGFLVNSGEYGGMSSEHGGEAIVKKLESLNCGKFAVNYKLRDWLISRQRYWSAPIPIIYCNKCGTVPVPEENLPVQLPFVSDWKPKGDGRGPLANVPDFVNTVCPVCGGNAERETDTLDNFLDSGWYFFRYPYSKRDDVPFGFKEESFKKWFPVHLYIGGAEHSVLHLMYTRFLTMALKDMGIISFDEPFCQFFAHGHVTKDGKKMSKSLGNIVNPDEYIDKIGADGFRMYLMFMGPYSQGGDFNEKGISGITRFLERFYRLVLRDATAPKEPKAGGEVEKSWAKTIAKVTEDIEGLRYNTAIAQMMTFINIWEKDTLSKSGVGDMVKILAPFAPFITEELWQEYFAKKGGEFKSVHKEPWPTVDPSLLLEDLVTIPVTVAGKLRGQIVVPLDRLEDEKLVLQIAKEEKQIAKFLANVSVKKEIYIKGEIVNFVV
jgi:leucyl-tRNA synthetase